MLQTGYADVMRDDQPARRRTRISLDALMHLPNFHAACSWIASGSRVPSFIGQTLPMEENAERIEAHLRAQRDRGALYPGPIPPPNRLAGYTKIQDLVPRQESEAATTGGGDGASVPAGGAVGGSAAASAPGETQRSANHDGRARRPTEAQRARAGPPRPRVDSGDGILDFAPERSSVDNQADRIGVAPLGSPTRAPVPESHTELDEFDDPTGLRWQQRPRGEQATAAEGG
jgi:hypothetical protein